MWCDSCGQFFHAGCLDVPFAETWGGRDTNTTFHLPFASKVKFSSRVHLLNKIGKKTLRTENRIILTPGSFEKRSPKRVALIINIKAW